MKAKFSDLDGKVLTQIVRYSGDADNDKIIFTCSDGSVFKMYHEQDCCESVVIKEIVGDLDSLLNQEIIIAEETIGTSEENDRDSDSHTSHTWTFYRLGTQYAIVTISWLGKSNGYYSESVKFKRIDENDQED